VIEMEADRAVAPARPSYDELVFRCEIRPVLQFESLIETMFSLATDGLTNARRMPNPFRPPYSHTHVDTVLLPFPPVPLQRAAFAIGAPRGRALGHGPTYEPALPLKPVAAAV
jgi:hypothetical protein